MSSNPPGRYPGSHADVRVLVLDDPPGRRALEAALTTRKPSDLDPDDATVLSYGYWNMSDTLFEASNEDSQNDSGDGASSSSAVPASLQNSTGWRSEPAMESTAENSRGWRSEGGVTAAAAVTAGDALSAMRLEGRMAEAAAAATGAAVAVAAGAAAAAAVTTEEHVGGMSWKRVFLSSRACQILLTTS
jgi:hypothetical protein